MPKSEPALSDWPRPSEPYDLAIAKTIGFQTLTLLRLYGLSEGKDKAFTRAEVIRDDMY